MSARLTVCYCWPAGEEHTQYAMRFINSYCSFPPLVDHDTVILTDPGELGEELELARNCLPKVSVFQCSAPGKDLSRYFAYADQASSDIMLCLGGSSYLRRPGWGVRVIRAFESMGGANMYGACGHTGAGPVRPHVRTTGFWISPAVLRRYPVRPQNHAERYMVEHGQGCISDWVRSQGGQCWVINFGSEYTLERANDDPQGYARGAQQNLLFGDRLTMPPYQPFA